VEGKTAGLADKMAAMKKEIMGKAADPLKKAGVDPEEVFGAAGRKSPILAETGSAMAAKLVEYKGVMKGKGMLTPDLESQVDEWIADIKKKTTEGQARYDAGMAKLERQRKRLKRR